MVDGLCVSKVFKIHTGRKKFHHTFASSLLYFLLQTFKLIVPSSFAFKSFPKYEGEARRFLINLQSQSQSQTNLLLFFHTTSNGLLICYLPIHSRHSCILKTFSQSSQRRLSPRCHHTMRKLLNVCAQA